MKKIALFAGTTEGKILAERLALAACGADSGSTEAADRACGSCAAFRADVFVATEYGKEGLPETGAIHVFCGRLTRQQMERRFSEESYDLVIDATHPYAVEVSENLRAACGSCRILYWRVLRDVAGAKPEENPGGIREENPGENRKENPGEFREENPEGNRKENPGGIRQENPEEIREENPEEIREENPEEIREESGRKRFWAADVSAALEFLKHTDGNILVTTGSKELARFRELPDWEERVYARVLSLPEVVQTCGALGFRGRHLIAMQGPFSAELNAAMLRSVNAKWLVTKESGRAGGYREKEEAAAETGAGLVVIARPEESGISMEEAIAGLERFLAPEREEAAGRIVWLVGAGPGNPELLTGEAKRAFEGCELLAGARRNVEQLAAFGKPSLAEYTAEKILAYLQEHPEYRRIAVALSGDTGFYSGARKLAAAFRALPDTEVRILPGISSMNYFFARLGKSWETVRLLSFHGQDAEIEKEMQAHAAVFLLAGGRDALRRISARLLAAGFSDVRMTVGENLSLPTERIETGTPETFAAREAEPLSVVLLERGRRTEGEPEPQTETQAEPETEAKTEQETQAGPETEAKTASARILTHGLEDEEFLRGEVPMTKQEVRAVALAKLRLHPGAVVWDIGAGTGSVSVECARLSETVRVYAVERKPEALDLLAGNRRKFGLPNLEVVAGTAPEALAALPAPTHVFIGGSGGSMYGLLRAALGKNPAARFVISAIMPETLAEILRCRRELAAASACRLTEPDIVQLTAARAKKVGPGHLMTGQNPVWIISFSGLG